MGVPQSNVDIYNMALGFIGERPVSSIDAPTTNNESIGARYYDNSRQVTLRNYLWNFAKKRATVTNTGIAPPFDYANSYQLPADFLRFISINGQDYYWNHQIKCYEITANKLLYYNGYATDPVTSLQIRYIADIVDVTLMPPDFIKVLAAQLAVDVAFAITKSTTVVKQMEALLEKTLPDATSITIQENPLRRVQRSKIINRRRGLDSNTLETYFDGSYGDGL